jgi:hypothetical protein
VLKWVGVVICAVILLLAIPSGFGQFGYLRTTDGGFVTSGVLFTGGLVCMSVNEVNPDHVGRWLCTARGDWQLAWHLRPWLHTSSSGLRMVVLPLWIPFLIVGLPTGLLWWRDRRTPKGHCQKCGYNLTGNVSGVCPECGTEFEREGKRA